MLSVTDLSSYLYCERKLFLQKVFGLREPLKPVLIKGSIRHKTYELIYSGEEKVVGGISPGMGLADVETAYREKCGEVLRKVIADSEERLAMFDLDPEGLFFSVLPSLTKEFDERASVVFRFCTEHNVFGKELWGKLEPKVEAELKIVSPDIGLTGIIDHIEVYSSGMVPVELKTGKMPRDGMWPGHRVQLMAYGILLENHFKTSIKEGFVHYLDAKEKRHLAFNPFMQIEIREMVEKVNGLLQARRLPGFVSNKQKCLSCGLKESCYNEAKMREMEGKVQKLPLSNKNQKV